MPQYVRRYRKGYPHLEETLLSAMGNIEPQRLLDTRYLDLAARPRSPSGSCCTFWNKPYLASAAVSLLQLKKVYI